MWNFQKMSKILEYKYQAMKHAKDWDEEEDDYALFTSQSNKKSPRKYLNDVVGSVESLDTICKKSNQNKGQKAKTSTKRNRVLKETLREKVIEICQKLSALIVENMDILHEISQKHAILLILLKVSKTTKWRIC